MHSCCQGVIKKFIRLWTEKSANNKKKPWYIGHKMGIINARLAQIKCPYEITRATHPMDDLPNWKASMFRAFALYYYVILEDILPPKYFEHFCQFSYALNILLQEKVSVDDINNVDVLLKQFVIDMEDLYDVKDIGINIHFLTHLAEHVLNWGCLWAHSTFIPEDFNGILLSLKNGTQEVFFLTDNLR